MKRIGVLTSGGSPSAGDRSLDTWLGVKGMDLIEVPFADVQKCIHAFDTGIAELVDIMAVMTRA